MEDHGQGPGGAKKLLDHTYASKALVEQLPVGHTLRATEDALRSITTTRVGSPGILGPIIRQ
jgi:hypothetical protein